MNLKGLKRVPLTMSVVLRLRRLVLVAQCMMGMRPCWVQIPFLPVRARCLASQLITRTLQRCSRPYRVKPTACYRAVAIDNREESLVLLSETWVAFRSITEQEMITYWETGEPKDKAGGYAIQGYGSVFC